LSYFPQLNWITVNEASASALIDPFIADKDSCGDNKDNDGDGFVDDTCGTKSLKVTNNMSGAVSNISSTCHEDCEVHVGDLE
jgi:hypothetical protein